MAVVGNFYFSIFLRLTWEFLGLESEHGDSVCWPNNKITREAARAFARLVLILEIYLAPLHLIIVCKFIFSQRRHLFYCIVCQIVKKN